MFNKQLFNLLGPIFFPFFIKCGTPIAGILFFMATQLNAFIFINSYTLIYVYNYGRWRHLKKIDSNNSSLFRRIVVVSSSPGLRSRSSPYFNGLVAVPIHGLVAVSFQSISTKEENDLYIIIAEIRTHDLPHPSKY